MKYSARIKKALDKSINPIALEKSTQTNTILIAQNDKIIELLVHIRNDLDSITPNY